MRKGADVAVALRAEISSEEYVQIRKDALSAGVSTQEYVAALLRTGSRIMATGADLAKVHGVETEREPGATGSDDAALTASVGRDAAASARAEAGAVTLASSRSVSAPLVNAPSEFKPDPKPGRK